MRLKRMLTDIVRFIQWGDIPTSYYISHGMKVGKNFNRQSGCKFDPSHCWLIEIGDDVTMSNQVIILAHDDCTRNELGYGRIGRVVIGNNVFVGARTTILMNTKIGDDVIIGACSLVTKPIPSGVVACGVPARIVGKTKDFLVQMREKLNNHPSFDLSYTVYGGVGNNLEKKRIMNEALSQSYGFQELWKYLDE